MHTGSRDAAELDVWGDPAHLLVAGCTNGAFCATFRFAISPAADFATVACLESTGMSLANRDAAELDVWGDPAHLLVIVTSPAEDFATAACLESTGMTSASRDAAELDAFREAGNPFIAVIAPADKLP